MDTQASPYLDCGARSETRAALERFSPFQKRFGSGNHLGRFDVGRIKLLEVVKDKLSRLGYYDGSKPLERIHEDLPLELLTADKSGQPPIAVAFYEAGPEILCEYKKLLKHFIQDELFGEPLYYQETPTFRFSIPQSPGYTWRPNYHSDIALGHPPMEVNVWMPITDCLPDNGLIYSELDASMQIWRDYDFDFRRFHHDLDERDDLQERCKAISKPLVCRYGDIFLFDSRSMHLSQRNRTQQTRISIDFRVVPLSDTNGLQHEYVGTGRRRLRFGPGGYYAPETTATL